jgi:hypothetical protein
LIIMGYSLGQWVAPWLAGRVFDAYHSYDLAWVIMTAAAIVGAALISVVTPDGCAYEGSASAESCAAAIPRFENREK